MVGWNLQITMPSAARHNEDTSSAVPIESSRGVVVSSISLLRLVSPTSSYIKCETLTRYTLRSFTKPVKKSIVIRKLKLLTLTIFQKRSPGENVEVFFSPRTKGNAAISIRFSNSENEDVYVTNRAVARTLIGRGGVAYSYIHVFPTDFCSN